MPQPNHWCLIAAATLLLPLPSSAQTRVAPIYSLPPDKAWIEFEWKAIGPDGKEQSGTLRISRVGEKNEHHWIEFAKSTQAGDKVTHEIRKLLVAPKAFRKGETLEGHIVEAFQQSATDGPVTKPSPAQLRTIANLGFDAPSGKLEGVNEKEEIKVPLGTFATRQVRAEGKVGDRPLIYHGWLTDDVPFGCCRWEIAEKNGTAPARIVFSAQAKRSGKDARSELNESGAK